MKVDKFKRKQTKSTTLNLRKQFILIVEMARLIPTEFVQIESEIIIISFGQDVSSVSVSINWLIDIKHVLLLATHRVYRTVYKYNRNCLLMQQTSKTTKL